MKKILTLFALLIAFAVNGFAQDTWTVAGSAAVFGTNWDVSDNSNNMTYDSGTGKWTLTKNNVTLTAGVSYEYKVVKNHSWKNENYGDGAEPGGSNKQFNVNETAIYDVTITFDPNNDTQKLSHVCTKVGEAENAEITQVDIRGGFNSWSVSDDHKFTKGDGDVYTLTLDLSSTTADQEFKLVINGTEWLGYQSNMTIDAPTGWIEDAGGNEHNYKLKNSTSGYKTYTLTATWVANSDAASGWTLKIEGATERPIAEVAEITSVQLMGDGVQPWTTNAFNVTLTKDGENNRWTGTLDLSNSALDQTFKLVVNGGGDESDGWKGWIGTNNLAISNTTPTGWVLATSENANENCTFYNSITGYKTYTLTAEWVPSSDYAAGWTLTIAGKDRRDYYVIGGNGEVWTVLGQMSYFKPMDEYDYVMDKSTSTFTGKYFAIAPESALNAAKDGVEDWTEVIRPVTKSGNFLVEMINYFEIKATSGSNINQVWELADDITEVVISYYISDNEFVLYPKSVVEITSAGYATYSNKDPYQIVGADVEVSIVKEVTTTEAVMNKLDIYTDLGESEIVKNIPAGTGVIVKGTGIFYVQPYGTNNHKDYVDVTGNMLIGSNNDTYNITGTYPAELGSGKYTAYVLKEINSKVGFYKVNDTDRNLAAHKAFLAIPTTSSGAPEFILIGGGDGTTGINATLRDNVNDNAIFDLSGRRVVNPTKGIYIVNGKKIVVK